MPKMINACTKIKQAEYYEINFFKHLHRNNNVRYTMLDVRCLKFVVLNYRALKPVVDKFKLTAF